jgi:hypothetical protein
LKLYVIPHTELLDLRHLQLFHLTCLSLTFSYQVGIGGPLISSDDGSLVGMNFYDDTDKTPFLPMSKIVDVLRGIELPSQR